MLLNYLIKLKQRLVKIIAELNASETDLTAAIRGALVVMIIRVAGAGTLYLSNVLLARWMGSFEYGIYAYTWVWVLVLGSIAPFGLNVAVLRYLPDYQVNEKWHRMNGMIRNSRTIVLGTSLFIAGIAALVVFMSRTGIDDYYITPLYIAFASVTLYALIDLYEGLARSFKWLKLAFAPSYLLRPAVLVIFLAFVVSAGIVPTASIALIAVFISGGLVLSVQAWLFSRRIATVVPRVRPVYHSWYWIRNSIPFLLVEAFYLVLTNTDIIMLGIYLEPDDVGIYFAASRTTNLIMFILFAIQAMLASQFSSLYAEKKHKQLAELFTGAIRWAFWPSLLAGVVLVVIGKPVLSLFGPGFVEGYTVLVILILSVLLKAAAGPVDLLLNMTGNQVRCAMVLGCSAVLNIILNILLIPRFGLVGAAIATTTSIVVSTGLFVLLAKSRLGIVAFALYSR
jgi:O-antigen/teichoic acid export membrane protein